MMNGLYIRTSESPFNGVCVGLCTVRDLEKKQITEVNEKNNHYTGSKTCEYALYIHKHTHGS